MKMSDDHPIKHTRRFGPRQIPVTREAPPTREVKIYAEVSSVRVPVGKDTQGQAWDKYVEEVSPHPGEYIILDQNAPVIDGADIIYWDGTEKRLL